MNRHQARTILNALNTLRGMGAVTPRAVKRISHGRVPHIRADLKALAQMGAVVAAGADRFAIGPRFDALHDAANWDEDDGTPDPGWQAA